MRVSASFHEVDGGSMSISNMEVLGKDSRLRLGRLTRHTGNDDHAGQEIATYTLCDIWRHGCTFQI
jgi:hypothetical protein